MLPVVHAKKNLSIVLILTMSLNGEKSEHLDTIIQPWETKIMECPFILCHIQGISLSIARWRWEVSLPHDSTKRLVNFTPSSKLNGSRI